MRRRTVGMLVAVGTAGAAVAAAIGLRAYDYVENDPRFCTSCHLMQSASLRPLH